MLLKGDERKDALADHEATGEWMVRATIAVIGLAFVAQIARARIDGIEWSRYIVPDHFHGWVGFLGLFLMLILRKHGRATRTLKTSGESFFRSKQMHGKISDVMLLLVIIHAFWGSCIYTQNSLTNAQPTSRAKPLDFDLYLNLDLSFYPFSILDWLNSTTTCVSMSATIWIKPCSQLESGRTDPLQYVGMS